MEGEPDDREESFGQRLISGVEATWEAVREEEDGTLAIGELVAETRRRRRTAARALAEAGVRKGMMRHLCVVVDASENMAEDDLAPNRLECALLATSRFVAEFFDENPISHLGLIVMQDRRARIVSELSGARHKHMEKIEELVNGRRDPASRGKVVDKLKAVGEASFQNALLVANKALQAVPSHATREILFVAGSLTSCDPTDVFTTVDELKRSNVRISVVGLAASVRLCELMAEKTGGRNDVVLDETHLRELLSNHTTPPVFDEDDAAALVHMGFPRLLANEKMPTACLCHQNSRDKLACFKNAGYYCPRCGAKHCEIPIQCMSCGLLLVSSPHLARTYHHLFPLEPFVEVSEEERRGLTQDILKCTGCTSTLASRQSDILRCRQCGNLFCFECDVYLHEVLHNCPGCNGRPDAARTTPSNAAIKRKADRTPEINHDVKRPKPSEDGVSP